MADQLDIYGSTAPIPSRPMTADEAAAAFRHAALEARLFSPDAFRQQPGQLSMSTDAPAEEHHS